MSFLSPWFLAGLVGIAVPIVIHLIQRDRKRVVQFPSLMFLERIPFRSMRRQTIRNWPLFLMRLAAIVLLALAFARPFLSRGGGDIGLVGPVERVVLLDRSYSLQWEGSFDRALDAARDAVGELQDGDRASVVTFDEGATVLARSTDVTTALRALDGVTPGARTTRFRPPLEVAQAILEQSQLGRREVVLVSDFQRGAWRGDEDVEMPTGTTVTPVEIRPQDDANVTLWSVGIERTRAGDLERVEPTARLVNMGSQPVSVPVTLSLGGRELESQAIELDGAGSGGSSALVEFRPFTLSSENTLAEVQVGDDALLADNRFHLVLDPEAAPSILVIEPDRPRANASLYLRRALEIGGEIPFRVTVQRLGRVTPDLIGRHSVVVFNGSGIESGSIGEALRRHVEEGGGVLVALDERTRWNESFADLLPGRFSGPADRPGASLGYMDYNHPVFELFSAPHSGDFTGARFFRYRAMEADSTADVLARFDDGGIALLEGRPGKGRVLVWTSGLDNFWNDLALQPVYLPYMHSLVQYLARRGNQSPSLNVGQVVDLTALADLTETEAADEEWTVLLPSGETEAVTPGSNGERFLALEEAGIHEVRRTPDGPGFMRIAANVDRAESDLAQIEPDVVLAAVGSTAPSNPGAGTGETVDERLALEAQEARNPLGWYSLFVVFGLLLLETALSNRWSRRAVQT